MVRFIPAQGEAKHMSTSETCNLTASFYKQGSAIAFSLTNVKAALSSDITRLRAVAHEKEPRSQ